MQLFDCVSQNDSEFFYVSDLLGTTRTSMVEQKSLNLYSKKFSSTFATVLCAFQTVCPAIANLVAML